MERYFKVKGSKDKESTLIARDDVQAAAFEKAGLIETDKAGKPLEKEESE